MERDRWVKLIGFFTVAGAIAALLVVPEIRRALGLDQPASPHPTLQMATQPQSIHSQAPKKAEPIAIATSGQFQVDATSPQGTLFKNEHKKAIAVRFVASGQWSFWPEQGFHSANGNPRYSVASISGPNYKLPEAPLGSLIVRRGHTYELVGNERTIHLTPNESIFFVMNDSDDYGKDYLDNRGIITVEWACLDCN